MLSISCLARGDLPFFELAVPQTYPGILALVVAESHRPQLFAEASAAAVLHDSFTVHVQFCPVSIESKDNLVPLTVLYRGSMMTIVETVNATVPAEHLELLSMVADGEVRSVRPKQRGFLFVGGLAQTNQTNESTTEDPAQR